MNRPEAMAWAVFCPPQSEEDYKVFWDRHHAEIYDEDCRECDDDQDHRTQGVIDLVPSSELDRLFRRMAELEGCEACLVRHGFTRCSSSACNCGSWHQTSGLAQRFEELKQDLEDAGHPLCNQNGHVFRTAFASLVEERNRWKREAMAARVFISMGRIEAWQPDEFHPGIPQHIEYKQARDANGGDK